MKDVTTDKAFLFTLLALIVLAGLVFAEKVPADALIYFLMGAAGPTAGRMGKREVRSNDTR